KIYQIIAGYYEDDAADQLTRDPVFTEIIDTPALASQPSLSRFYTRFNQESIDHLNQANQELRDKIHAFRKSQALFIDLDSTHSDTYGNQESSSFNAHYGTLGFHPLVAFDGATGDFLKAKLRPGNVYTSNGVVEFIQPLIEHYNETFPETSLFLRGDSGFAVPALYELCERESVYYVIRLKSNAQLKSLAEEYHPTSVPEDVSKTERYFEETIYQAKSWLKPRKVIIQSVRPAGELFFTHSFFVTNFEIASPKDIVQAYQKRGTMENYIKEAKNGFGFDRMNSHSYLVNAVKMILSLLAYNLTNWLRTLCFPEGQKTMQIDTIRTRIIKVASRLVKSGRSLYFKLSSSFVYQKFFWNVLGRIQKLQIE
ncbi:IS1380 family transposase, partial [Bacillus andreraoultii]|uniref:IS1380 family transposase n=1 Tax=Bacillus andreraoultii TaxID=1499685 RepID=UPI000539D101